MLTTRRKINGEALGLLGFCFSQAQCETKNKFMSMIQSRANKAVIT